MDQSCISSNISTNFNELFPWQPPSLEPKKPHQTLSYFNSELVTLPRRTVLLTWTFKQLWPTLNETYCCSRKSRSPGNSCCRKIWNRQGNETQGDVGPRTCCWIPPTWSCHSSDGLCVCTTGTILRLTNSFHPNQGAKVTS